MLSLSSSGSFDKLEQSLRRMQYIPFRSVLEANAKIGVDALADNTPVESGLAAQSWDYQISQNGSGFVISWINTDVETGFPVAIMLQYGYATGTGGYVAGRDYINPAIQPIFDKIAEDIWKAVTSA